MRRLLLAVAVVLFASCTSSYQLRGVETKPEIVYKLSDFVIDPKVDTTPAQIAIKKERQISMEHRSVERFEKFTLGVIEISDDGDINPAQHRQVIEMVDKETANGGLLIVFIHGWHHGPRTCDRDLCCFRRVLDELQRRRETVLDDGKPAFAGQKTVGVYIGWRGESMAVPKLNVLTLPSRKRVAQRIGRTAGKEILIELDALWRQRPDLTMVSVGHSLGGAFLFEAMKGKLTGNVTDIYDENLQNRRVVRARESREAAASSVPPRKAKRADIGDLVVLVNPAIEAVEWSPFENDLRDQRTPSDPQALIRARLPYDKNLPYDGVTDEPQLPVLMTVASKADTAVGRFFAISRWLQFLVTLRWDMFFKPQEWRGLGHYNEQTTHALNFPEEDKRAYATESGETYDPAELTTPTCDCPFKNISGLAGSSNFSLLALDHKQNFGKDNAYEMDVTPARTRHGAWDVRAPFFVVSTNKGVISAHSDIYNRAFVGFLITFIEAYDIAQTARQADQKKR